MDKGLDNSLHSPLDPQWRLEPGYGAEAAHRIAQAHAWLKGSVTATATSADPYLEAYRCALSCFKRPMSLRQQLQAAYAAGLACVGGEAYSTGLRYLDEAFELAEDLREWGSWAEIAALYAAVESELFHYRPAAGYLTDGLGLIRRFNGRRDPHYMALATDMLLTRSVCWYVLEEYGRAERDLRVADTEAAQLPDTRVSLRRPSIAWMQAVVARWRGDPGRALVFAQQAAAAFSTATTPATRRSWGRLQTILADITLDLAERLPAMPMRLPTTFLQLGAHYTTDAVRYTRAGGDEIGEGMARLAQARYRRLAGRTDNHRAMIERVIHTAEQLGDVALVAQGYTSLGIELLYVTPPTISDEGVNCLRTAIDVARPGDIPALGAWARRALVAAARRQL